MKKFYSWMTAVAVALSFGFTSCSDSDDDAVVEAAAPELLAFSFNEAQNAEALSADYTGVISEADKTVKVTMPAFADKSSLVATFTVGKDNKVLVNGVTQESGVTANDFSAPVDYIISSADGTKNVKYTVTVEKAAAYEWAEAGRFSEVEYFGTTPTMVINPVDNLPYISMVSKDKTKIYTVKYDNDFNYVGPSTGIDCKVNSSAFAFNISNTGTPYILYSDATITDPVKNAPTAMKFDGGNWSVVGQTGFVPFTPSKVMFGVIDDVIIAPMVSNTTSSSYTRNAAYASVYNGSWATSDLAGVSIDLVAQMCFTTTDNAGYLYAVTRPDSEKKVFYSVVEYKNGVWSSLRSNFLEPNATQCASIMADALSIAATNDGVVYVLTADDAETGDTGDMRFRILKCTSDTKEWTLVGGTTLSSVKANSRSVEAKLAIAPDGTPFFAYVDYTVDKFIRFQYFDNETKQWTEPVAVSSEASKNLNFGFCNNGEAYISYLDANNSVVLVKYAAKK